MHATPNNNAPQKLDIDGALSIYTAADTKPRLNSALQGTLALQIDLSAVDEFDCAGLQLLLATCEQARRMDIDLHFTGVSPVVTELFKLAGLGELLLTQEAKR